VWLLFLLGALLGFALRVALAGHLQGGFEDAGFSNGAIGGWRACDRGRGGVGGSCTGGVGGGGRLLVEFRETLETVVAGFDFRVAHPGWTASLVDVHFPIFPDGTTAGRGAQAGLVLGEFFGDALADEGEAVRADPDAVDNVAGGFV
jgi:hypothetical protein